MLKFFNKEIHRKIQIRNANAEISDLIKKKKKVNHMVITNSAIFFISHSPEFVASVLLIGFKMRITEFCGHQPACDLINEEAQFFNSISIFIEFLRFFKI